MHLFLSCIAKLLMAFHTSNCLKKGSNAFSILYGGYHLNIMFLTIVVLNEHVLFYYHIEITSV